MTVADRLARVRPGARIRLFFVVQGDKHAVSGTLLGMTAASVRVDTDGDGELSVPTAALTCMYLPKRPSTSLAGRIERALRALVSRRAVVPGRAEAETRRALHYVRVALDDQHDVAGVEESIEDAQELADIVS
jgi:hypothetical protein